MNRVTICLFSLLFALMFFMNCEQSNSHSRHPVTAIKPVPNKKSYRLGEEIQLNMQTKLKDGSLDKIEIFVDSKILKTSNNLTDSFIFKTAAFGVGKHTIKVSVTKKDGVRGDNYDEIFVTSDIKPIKYSYQIVAEYPHNVGYYTQGLEFYDNALYEGTGQEGFSAIYRINLPTNKVEKEYKLEDQYFGEGITILNKKIYQLTYKNKVGFVYDLNTFKVLNTWKFRSNEGWGLTNDGHSLIMSDGTENLFFINPDTFEQERKIQVCNEYDVVQYLNEMEYIKGEIWANVWNTDNIVIIDPKTGKIKGEINLTGLSGTILQNQKEKMDVLNGIAWNPVTEKIYVTGKLWPKIFEIKLLKNTN